MDSHAPDLDIPSWTHSGSSRIPFWAYTNPTVYERDPKDMKDGGRAMLDTKRGLDLLAEFIGEPGDRNPLQYEFTFGARYTGLFDCRPTDKIGFGLIYSDNGNAYSDAYETQFNGQRGGLGGETTVELDYQYNPAPWLSIQPDMQYIFDPGGDSSRSDMLVLGRNSNGPDPYRPAGPVIRVCLRSARCPVVIIGAVDDVALDPSDHVPESWQRALEGSGAAR